MTNEIKLLRSLAQTIQNQYPEAAQRLHDLANKKVAESKVEFEEVRSLGKPSNTSKESQFSLFMSQS